MSLKKRIFELLKTYPTLTDANIQEFANIEHIDSYKLQDYFYRLARKYVKSLESNDGELMLWWNNLDSDWQAILKDSINCQHNPSIEEINDMLDVKSINGEHFDINYCEPLYRLTRLKDCNLRNTQVSNIDPLKNLKELESLDLTYSMVGSLKPIWDLPNIKLLKLKRCAKLNYTEISDYIKSHPQCKVDWDYSNEKHWIDYMNGIM